MFNGSRARYEHVMIDRDEALLLFDYDAWANETVEAALRQHAPDDADALGRFAHVLAALDVWLRRVRGEETPGFDVNPKWTLAECAIERVRLASAWRTFVKGMVPADFEREVAFLSLRGVPARDPIGAILRQLSHHGTHHRGQIAARLRVLGATPPSLDHIGWSRARRARTQPAKHFAVIVTYHVPLARIDASVVAHRAHLERGFAEGILLASGPQVPREGGVLLARAASREIVERFLADDPFAREQLADYRVIEFDPIKRAPAFDAWLAAP